MNVTTAMIKDLRQATGAGPLDCKQALEAFAGDYDRAVEHLRERGLSRATRKADRETHAGLVIVESSDQATCAVELNCETDFVAFTAEFKALGHRIAERVLGDTSLTDADKVLADDGLYPTGQTTAGVIQHLIGQLDENIVLRRVARYPAESTGVLEGYVHAGDLEGHYGPTEGRVGVIVELRVGENPTLHHELLRALAHDLALQIAANHPSYVAPEHVPESIVREQREGWLDQLRQANKPEPIRAQIVDGQFRKFFQEACLLNQPFVKDDRITVTQLVLQQSEAIGIPITIARFARFEVGA